MIHRIDRVNPDVDDRVIKPNEARMAVNLRFGASTEDTNLSGGTLILGNKKIDSFVPPAGENKVVGVYADLESRNVYFAMYNDGGNHGIYKINGETDAIEPIAKGSWLNFQNANDYNVSITAAAGRLYWTDNVNEPRIINIEKGIRTQLGLSGDVYPPVIVDWYYAQIKRPPAYPILVPQLSISETSKTVLNKTQVAGGLQYSYYYIYDNGEESRLAPYSEITYANYNVNIAIPNEEYLYATDKYQIIKSVVIVVRQGNDGVWREVVYSTTDGTSPVPQFYSFPNILTLIKGSVATDITDARFDSVPLLSKTNEIAQNRINHANYVLDRTFDGIKIQAKIDYRINFINEPPLYNYTKLDPKFDRYSFLPWGRYSIGVELVDEYGRTFPVGNTVDVVAPHTIQSWSTRSGAIYGAGSAIPLSYQSNEEGLILVNDYNQNSLNTPWEWLYGLVAEYNITLSKPLPSWVKKVNVVRSKSKNIVKMIQSIGTMLLWYDTQEGIAVPTSWVQPQLQNYTYLNQLQNMDSIFDMATGNVKYTFMGYILTFNPAETPIVFEEDMYITLVVMYNFKSPSASPPPTFNYTNQNYWSDVSSYQDAGRLGSQAKFKVHKIVGNQIYIKATDPISISNPTNATQVGGVDLSKRIVMTPYSFATTVQTGGVLDPYMAVDDTKSLLLTYSFTITVEKSIDDQIVYDVPGYSYFANDFSNLIAQNGSITDYLTGDASMCRVSKTMPAMAYNCAIYAGRRIYDNGQSSQGPIYNSGKTIRMQSYPWAGTFISMSPRDIYDERWNQNIGQFNTTNYSPSQPQRLESAICFSAPFIQGTQTNGLNKFNSLDFRLAPAENGPITSLVTTNATQREPGVLLSIGTYGISSFYYDAIQLTNVDGSNNVTTTDAYLASQRPLLGQYGCKRPMSVTKTPLGTVYWWSDVVNDLIRYTNAGLERLGMTFSFSNYLRKTFQGNPYITTWYDQITDEINIIGSGTKAATFSERYKTFQGQRDYFNALGQFPERSIGMPTKIYQFLLGNVYLSNVNDSLIPDNFLFDSYKDPELTIITNESPATVKRWNQVKVFGSKPKFTLMYTTVGNEQIDLTTIIDPGYYINRKGDWEAAIRRAVNTEGGLMAGKLMESRILYSNFAFDAEGFEKLNFIEVKSNVSIVQ